MPVSDLYNGWLDECDPITKLEPMLHEAQAWHDNPWMIRRDSGTAAITEVKTDET